MVVFFFCFSVTIKPYFFSKCKNKNDSFRGSSWDPWDEAFSLDCSDT